MKPISALTDDEKRRAGLPIDDRFYRIIHSGKEHTLPSVTSVIGRTLAKPELVTWAYRQTVEGFAILLRQISDFADLEGLSEVDVEDLDEWLTSNRLRPSDIRDEASTRGKEAHALLERLVQGDRRSIPDNGWCKGVVAWYNERKPLVLLSEHTVYKVDGRGRGYAGTLDLVYKDDNGKIVTMDLKTRKEQFPWWSVRKGEWVTSAPSVYMSDEIQVKAYQEALNWSAHLYPEMGARRSMRSTVLAVGADGSWTEKEVRVLAKVFENLVENYYILGGKGGLVDG